MNRSSKSHNAIALYLRIIRPVALLLLFIFVGRVALVSVYGFAGVPKHNASRVNSEASEQENDDKKEENKYAEKQFKCFTPDVHGQPVLKVLFFDGHHYASFITGAITACFLKVLTPPPNR